MMQTKHEIIEKLKPILVRYSIKQAGVFGSFARGDYTSKSDVDLVIALDHDSNSALAETYYGFWDDAETALGLTVDLISLQSLAESTKKRFKQRVYNDLEWFYEV